MRNTAGDASGRATKLEKRALSPSTLSAVSLSLLALLTLTAMPSVRAQAPPLIIISLTTTDQAGNPRSVFSRGELVVVRVTIDYPDVGYSPVSIGYMQFVRITDSHIYMVCLGFVSDAIAPGESKSSSSGYMVSPAATTGTYRVKVMVSNTRPNNPAFEVLAEPDETTFTVT